MKRTIRWFAIAATLALCSAPVLAQSSAAKECNEETKTSLYTKYYENLKKDQAVSYAAAKEYLAACPQDDDQYTKALKSFVGRYEVALRKNQFEESFGKKEYAKTAELGKQLLAEDPTNVRVFMLLGYGGFLAAGTNPMSAESVEYATKAIQMIESGKPPESWVPFTSRDQGLAWLNYAIGKAKLTSAPGDALPYLIKAARYESELKKLSGTYGDIITAYKNGPRAKLTEEYEAKYKGQPESPESKLAAANIDQIIDREIDAYARVAALTTAAADKKAVMDELTDLYKYRNKSDAGVNELVAGILSKPLPDVPTPLMTLPTPAPTPTTPATTGAAPNPTPNTTSGTTATKAGTNATTQPQSTAKPSPTPKPPAKPRRANHRRRG